MEVVAGVDLGGTAVNYTFLNREEKFLIEGLCEHPSLAKQGPDVCLRQIEDGLKVAAERAGVALAEIVAVGLDTPGPASAAGMLSAQGFDEFCARRLGGVRYPRRAGDTTGKTSLLFERRECRSVVGALLDFRRNGERNICVGGDRYGTGRWSDSGRQRYQGTKGIWRRAGTRADSLPEY